MIKQDWIWRDGELVAWDTATVHVMTHSLHYGLAVFEGIRCYPQRSGGAAIFRLEEHVDRLFRSAHMCMMKIPFTREQLLDASRELVRRNELLDGCYLRPLAYMGEGAMGIAAENPVHVQLMAWRWGAYLGEEGLRNGIRTKVSSFRRPNGDAMLAKAKITGQYVTSILARREALRAGYQEALMLDAQGYVSEGSGENIFIVTDGKVRTPPLGSAILAGVTRDTALTMLRDEGYVVSEEHIARDELYCAEEIFLTGTAAEITPVREVDDRAVGEGKPGPITRRIQELYAKTVHGEVEKYQGWLTRV